MAVVSLSLTPEVIGALFKAMSERGVEKPPREPYNRTEISAIHAKLGSNKAVKVIKLREDLFGAYQRRTRMNQSRYVDNILREHLKLPPLDVLEPSDIEAQLLKEADAAANAAKRASLKPPPVQAAKKETKQKVA